MIGRIKQKVQNLESVMSNVANEPSHKTNFLVLLTLVFSTCYTLIIATYFGVRDDDNHETVWAILCAVLFVLSLVVAYRLWTGNSASVVSSSSGGGFSSSFQLVQESLGIGGNRSEMAQVPDRILQADAMKFIINVCVGLTVLFQVRNQHDTPDFWNWFMRAVECWLMPAAALLSGMVYKPEYTKENSAKSFMLIASYFPLQFFYLMFLKLCLLDQHPEDKFLYAHYVKLDSSKDPLPWYLVIGDLVRPFWHLWYIWALFIWRILAPMWMQLKHPIILSLTLAIASGFFYAESCEVYRTLGYFPYFIVGNKMRNGGVSQLLEICADKTVKLWAVALLLLNALFAWYATHADVCHNYFGIGAVGRYVDMKCNGYFSSDIDRYWVNMFARFASYPMAGVLIFAMLALMPSADNIIRQCGSRMPGPYTLVLVPYMFLRAYTGIVDDFHWGNDIALVLVQVLWMALLYVPQVHEMATQYLLYTPLDRIGMLED
jgi:hypothetical protein